jgi:hypothetical protein
MAVEEGTVAPFDLYEVPRCPSCHTPFTLHHGAGESYETWQQACQCLPQENCAYMRSYPPHEGRGYMQEFFQGASIGKPLVRACLLCGQPMREGERAMRGGPLGVYSYYGYAHLACYEQEQRKKRAALEAADAAERGVRIAFWFAWDDLLIAAPNTGHYDGEVRMVPESLPPFPPGAVVSEMYRRPFAMCFVAIADREDAEKWWSTATAHEDGAYELHWYEPGQQQEQASRSWRGKGFSQVESKARLAEWDALRRQGM